MKYTYQLVITTLTAAMFAGAAHAQSVISAKSGLIHYMEGEVLLAGKQITPKRSEFPRLEQGQTLQTKVGRAELLLTPGVFLRLSEDSEARLDSGELSDTRVELLSGSALVEVGEMEKGNSVVLTVRDSRLEFRKSGLFRINADPAKAQAFDGEVTVVSGQQTLTLKKGKETQLGSVLLAEKFEREDTDAFYRWSSRRAGYLASANIAAAKSVFDSGTTWSRGGWFYSGLLGMYTYLPGSSNYFSPFGYSYYSPRRVSSFFYRPSPVWYNGGGGNLGNSAAIGGSRESMGGGQMRSSAGYSGGGYSSVAPAGPAASAPAAAPRGAAGGGGGRGSSGGGR